MKKSSLEVPVNEPRTAELGGSRGGPGSARAAGREGSGQEERMVRAVELDQGKVQKNLGKPPPSLAVYKKGGITIVEKTSAPRNDKAPNSDQIRVNKRAATVSTASKQLIEYTARGNLEMVQVCLSMGADVTYTNYDGRTALHLAAAENREEIARYLLGKGAPFTVQDRHGQTPLDNALRTGSYLALQVLHDFGAPIEPAMLRGMRELHTVAGFELISGAAEGDIECVRKLVSYGVDVNARNYDQRTALHVAIADNLDEMAAELVELGADPYLQDRWGVTPIGEALRNGNMALAQMLGYKEPGVFTKDHNSSGGHSEGLES